MSALLKIGSGVDVMNKVDIADDWPFPNLGWEFGVLSLMLGTKFMKNIKR